MRVLWLSVTAGLYSMGGVNGYNGGGWVSSLQELMEKKLDIFLGVVFLSHKKTSKIERGNTIYYNIKRKNTSTFGKLVRYYGKYKKNDPDAYHEEIKKIVADFSPDIIHLFGLENAFSNCLLWNDISIPIIVHLQGLLLPCANMYWPNGQNIYSYIWPPTIKEWIFRNGRIFGKKNIDVRAEWERFLFKGLRYVMGRTDWDKNLSGFLAGNRKYYHVDEVLRPAFYEAKGTWRTKDNNKYIIISTISDNTYKGLDLILKCAREIVLNKNIDFKWKIIGITQCSDIVKQFERYTNVCSKDVNIEYLGTLTADKIVLNLQKASIYVHPSYIDNSPNSVCEAQLIGIPVIATFVGGITSLIKDGETGFFVPANAPFILAAKICYLLKHCEICKEVANNGYLTANNRHDKNKIYSNILMSYKAVITDYSKSKNQSKK